MSKEYKVWCKGNKTTTTKTISVGDFAVSHDVVACVYAEENGLDDGDVVVIEGIGSFKILVCHDPEYFALPMI